MQTAQFTVETKSILNEARELFIDQGPAAFGAAMGITLIAEGLTSFAKRSVELDDPELLSVCQRLCLVHNATAEKEQRPAHSELDRE